MGACDGVGDVLGAIELDEVHGVGLPRKRQVERHVGGDIEELVEICIIVVGQRPTVALTDIMAVNVLLVIAGHKDIALVFVDFIDPGRFVVHQGEAVRVVTGSGKRLVIA